MYKTSRGEQVAMLFAETIWLFVENTLACMKPNHNVMVCLLFIGDSKKLFTINFIYLFFKITTMKQNLNAMKKVAGIALAAMVTLMACKKDSSSGSQDSDTAVTLASSGSTSQSVYDDAFDVITTEGENNSVNGRVST